MYPTFSDLLYDLIGIQIPLPIQMFGLMVAISFLVGNYIIGLELKRKYAEGLLSTHTTTVIEGLPVTKMELLSNAIFGFIIGFNPVGCFFFGYPADFSDHYNSFCFRVDHEPFQAVDEVCAVNRITTNADRSWLT